MNHPRWAVCELGLAVLLLAGGFTTLSAAPVLPGTVKGIKVLDPGQFEQAGWKVSRPPYSFAAMAAHEQGTVYVQLTTDASGRVVSATTAKKTTHPHLDADLVAWMKSNGHGPPSTTVITFFTFRLQ